MQRESALEVAVEIMIEMPGREDIAIGHLLGLAQSEFKALAEEESRLRTENERLRERYEQADEDLDFAATDVVIGRDEVARLEHENERLRDAISEAMGASAKGYGKHVRRTLERALRESPHEPVEEVSNNGEALRLRGLITEACEILEDRSVSAYRSRTKVLNLLKGEREVEF